LLWCGADGGQGSRKVQQAKAQEVKYCSDGCRRHKPGPLDRKIEKTIVDLLNAEPGSGIEDTGAKSRVVKGDHRVMVTCDEIEEIMFGERRRQEKMDDANEHHHSASLNGDIGDKDDQGPIHKERAAPSNITTREEMSQETEETLTSAPTDDRSDGDVSSVGHETDGSTESRSRQAGQRRADQREMVRKAARRGVVFGFVQAPTANNLPESRTKGEKRARHTDKHDVDADAGPIRRKCEAVMNGSVVEPSFAKGNWAIRWREDS